MALINVSDLYIVIIFTYLPCQSKISSQKDILAAWGLEGSDITFIRRELVMTLFKYVSRGDATVEYDD